MAKLDFLDHVAIKVRDPEASAKWYQEVLGLARVQPEEWKPVPIMMFAGESGIALFSAGEEGVPAAFKASFHIAFRAGLDDMNAMRKRLEEHGVSVHFEDHIYFHSIYFTDPDGYRLEITAPIKPIND